MKGPIVQHQQGKGRDKGLGKVVSPELKHGTVQERELQEKAVACCWGDGPEAVEIVKPRPHRRHWLHAACRNPPPEDGLQAEARFILRTDLHGEAIMIPCKLLGELRR
jgi:hypothetical protein